MKFLLLLIPIIVSSAAQNSECTSEAANAARQCYLTHLKYFGYSEIPTSDDFIKMVTGINNGTEVEVRKNICNWFKRLDSCLVPVINECNSSEGYQQIFKPDERSAAGYFTFYVFKQLQCSKGYDSVVKAFGCMKSVEVNRTEEMAKCDPYFSKLSFGDPSSCS